MVVQKRWLKGQNLKKWLTISTAAIVISSWANIASALEIRTKVGKVAEDGKLELTLPQGTMVAIGDKVRIEVKLPGLEPTAIKTRWTVKSVDDGVIKASPDGEPTSTPKIDYDAVINTIANQPTVAVSEPAQAEMQKPEPATEENAEVPSVEETEKEAAPEAQSSETVSSTEAEKPDQSTPEAKTEQVESDAKTEEKPALEMSDKAKPTDATEQEAKPELRGTMVNTPAGEHECDRLAAHPFDPDAVVRGLDYQALKPQKIIDACNDAIASHPKEARFYTQLTRGLHKAGKLDEAFDATMKGAELGSAHSMAYLGVMYSQGKPISKDLGKSLNWFEQAAAKGNPGRHGLCGCDVSRWQWHHPQLQTRRRTLSHG